MRITWLTDIHLEMVDEETFEKLMESVGSKCPEAVLLGGDTAVSGSASKWLLRIANAVKVPVYFVLGNHDYYYGSIDQVRKQVAELCDFSPALRWLPKAGPIMMTEDCALIGHGGWGDGRYGDYDASSVRLNDYVMIEELSTISKQERLARLNALGDDAADSLRTQLESALQLARHVYALMHVPPFREAALHEGIPSDDDYAPHFSCKAVGDMLLDVMVDNPGKQLTVLCGHTHGGGETKMADNLNVITGVATYREPAIARVLEI
jgi:Icc-related predicted phosphoesterase